MNEQALIFVRDYEPPSICGVKRTSHSLRTPVCELPPGHIAGVNDLGRAHVGRSKSGRWYSWEDDNTARLH